MGILDNTNLTTPPAHRRKRDLERETRALKARLAAREQHGFYVVPAYSTLWREIGKFEHNQTIHAVMLGYEYGVLDVVRHFATQFKPCKFLGITFSITAPMAEKLVDLVKVGLIIDPILVLDHQISRNRPGLVKVLNEHGVRTSKVGNHSKVCVLLHPDCSCAIISSANMSRNPRREVFVITTVTEAVGFYKDWILREYNGDFGA